MAQKQYHLLKNKYCISFKKRLQVNLEPFFYFISSNYRLSPQFNFSKYINIIYSIKNKLY